MRRQRIVRIKPLWLFAGINAGQFQRVELRRNLHVQAADDPDELFVSVLCFGKLTREVGAILTCYRRNLAGRCVRILDLAGVREKRFSVETARQLSALTIENLSARRGDRKSTRLNSSHVSES